MKNSMAKLAVSLAALILLGGAQVSQAEDAESLASFFPDQTTYPGGFSAYGGTEVDAGEGSDVVTVKNTKTVGFVRWFVRHQPLSRTAAEDWKGKYILLELQNLNENGGRVQLSAEWRGSLEPIELSDAATSDGDLASGKSTTVTVPVPDATGLDTDNLTGLVIKIEPAGEYEIKRIDIVAEAATN